MASKNEQWWASRMVPKAISNAFNLKDVVPRGSFEARNQKIVPIKVKCLRTAVLVRVPILAKTAWESI